MFCKRCGAELPENTVICTKCGANQEAEVEGHFSKKKKIIVASVAVVILLIAVVALAIVNQPKMKVMIGFSNTEKAILKQKGGLDEFLGLSQLSKSAKSNAFQHTMSLDYDGNVFGSMGVKMNAVTDYKNEQVQAQVYPMYKNQEITELILYSNKEKSVIGLPDLYDKYLFMNNVDGEDYTTYSKEVWKSIHKNMKVKKAGKKQFVIGGKNKTCRGYEIVIPKEDIKNLIDNFSEYYEKSTDEVKNLPYQKDYSSRLDEFRDMWEEDLVVTVYLDSKWRAVSVESEYSIDISGETVETEFTCSLLGKQNPLQTMEGELIMQSEGEGITLNFSRNQEMKETNLTDTIEISADDGYDSKKLGLEGNVNTETGDWEVDMTADGENALTAKGTIKNIKKGKSFTISLDSLQSDEYFELKHLTGSYSIEPYSGEKITDPSEGKDTANLSEMSKEEVNKMLEEMGRKVSALCLSLIM